MPSLSERLTEVPIRHPSRAPLTILCVALAACGAEGNNDDVEPGSLSGTWIVTVASRAADCDGVDSGGTYFLRVPTGLPQTGSTAYVNGAWGTDTIPSPTDSLTGNVDVTDGTVFFRLWKTKLVTGAQLDGTISPTGAFSGTLTDPAPGYAPIFVTTTCIFPATGQVIN